MSKQDVKAYDIACFLSLLNDSYEEYGDVMTNLKLQKLVYYVQGFHLALFNKPLFSDEIYAWQYGPVVPSLYNRLKKFGKSEVKIQSDEPLDDIFTETQKKLMRDVFEQLGQFSAWKLMRMTHSESPWRETDINSVISHDKMSAFFKTKLID